MYYPTLGFEILLVVLVLITTVKHISHMRMLALWNRTSIFAILLRDNVLYFLGYVVDLP